MRVTTSEIWLSDRGQCREQSFKDALDRAENRMETVMDSDPRETPVCAVGYVRKVGKADMRTWVV
jgi:hypothetical protein